MVCVIDLIGFVDFVRNFCFLRLWGLIDWILCRRLGQRRRGWSIWSLFKRRRFERRSVSSTFMAMRRTGLVHWGPALRLSRALWSLLSVLCTISSTAFRLRFLSSSIARLVFFLLLLFYACSSYKFLFGFFSDWFIRCLWSIINFSLWIKTSQLSNSMESLNEFLWRLNS